MLLYSVADKIVFSILRRINVGFLEITTFSGQVLKFGNPNDKLKANLKIKTPALNYNLIKGGSVGLAECYMRDEFETNNLSDLIELTARNINIVHKFAGVLDLKFLNFIKNRFIKNTKKEVRKILQNIMTLEMIFSHSGLIKHLLTRVQYLTIKIKIYLLHKIINTKS